MILASLAETDLQFGVAAFIKIELQRRDRIALALHRLNETRDLPLAQEQFARALGRMVFSVAGGVFGNVGVDKPDAVFFRRGVGFPDGRMAFAQRLDLRAREHKTRFEDVFDLIVPACLPVLRDHLSPVASTVAFFARRHQPIRSSSSRTARTRAFVSARNSTSGSRTSARHRPMSDMAYFTGAGLVS